MKHIKYKTAVSDSAFALAVSQWIRAAVLGLIMAALYLAITFGADVWAIVRGM